MWLSSLSSQAVLLVEQVTGDTLPHSSMPSEAEERISIDKRRERDNIEQWNYLLNSLKTVDVFYVFLFSMNNKR